jgi:hypothetical protein
MQTSRWTVEQARQWYDRQPWLVGCNFTPSTAINQLEMWQAETFDPQTIERELGWAAGLGFNAVRVFLHDLLWQQDAAGLKTRMNRFLDLAHRHGIRTLFVLFDDCWHDDAHLGPQPAPRPGVHNSGWVKSPGTKVLKHPDQWGRLEGYVGDIVSAFGQDERVVAWDLYNEPGNNFLVSLNLPGLLRAGALVGQVARHFLGPARSAALVKLAFAWARAAQPAQPLTCGPWYLRPSISDRLARLSVELSAVVSFPSYFPLPETQKIVAGLRRSGRPLLCTEYLARSSGSRFETHLPYFKQEKIGAFNWGLVSGKTQTIYSWQDYMPSGEEPPLWYHDILRADGSCYRAEECEVLRRVTASA